MDHDPIKELREKIKLQKSIEPRLKKLLKKKKTRTIARKAKMKNGSIKIEVPLSVKWFCDKHKIPYENFMRIKKFAHAAEIETLRAIDKALSAEGV